MKLLKYQANNVRDALAQIKEELGDAAMVVSTRETKRGLLGKGVEVTVALDVDEQTSREPKREVPPSSSSPSFSLADADIERIMGPLRSELRSLRSLMRSSSDHRQGDEIRKEVSAMRHALEKIRQPQTSDLDVKKLLAEHTITAPSQGRIVVLVGPTGVGKTTTIAKLAAQTVYVQHQSAAIVTLDT